MVERPGVRGLVTATWSLGVRLVDRGVKGYASRASDLSQKLGIGAAIAHRGEVESVCTGVVVGGVVGVVGGSVVGVVGGGVVCVVAVWANIEGEEVGVGGGWGGR